MRRLRRQKGFLRLRTGRLSFYIDFSEADTVLQLPKCDSRDRRAATILYASAR